MLNNAKHRNVITSKAKDRDVRGELIENERSPARPSRVERLWDDRHHIVVDEADVLFVYNETSALHRPLQKLDGDAIVAHCSHFSSELPVAQLGDDEITD